VKFLVQLTHLPVAGFIRDAIEQQMNAEPPNLLYRLRMVSARLPVSTHLTEGFTSLLLFDALLILSDISLPVSDRNKLFLQM